MEENEELSPVQRAQILLDGKSDRDIEIIWECLGFIELEDQEGDWNGITFDRWCEMVKSELDFRRARAAGRM